ncbi:MAG: hypothetical protein AB7F88_15005 [Pyrinomonadaceae bacterium]
MKTIQIRMFAALCVMLTACFGVGFAQGKQSRGANTVDHKGSPAFAEIRLKQAELESELEAYLIEYTDEYPKVKELRATLGFLKRESERLAGANSVQRLTPALGKLMVRKAELETEVWRLSETLQRAHPDVKRAKRRVEIFESAIKEILG